MVRGRAVTYPQQKRIEVLEAYRDNHSSLKTAELTGVSHSTVCRIVNAFGEKYERPPLTFEALRADPGHPSHGKLTGYDAGCRCELCRNRRKVYDKKMQVKRVLAGKDPYVKRDRQDD